MKDEPNSLDLKLWLDQDVIPRQNKLKSEFWEILAEVGNAIDSEDLIKIHAKSKGVKLTKGSELLGYPYQVLDLIRDFDAESGLNIRLLNWFGHGLYLFVLAGKNHPKAPLQNLEEQNWFFDSSTTPWEYPEVILKRPSISSPTVQMLEASTFYQWYKPIRISGDTIQIKAGILGELKKLLFLLS